MDLQIIGSRIQRITSISQLSPRYTPEDGEKKSLRGSKLAAKLGSLTSGQMVILPNQLSKVDVTRFTTEEYCALRALAISISDFEKGRTNAASIIRFGQLLIQDDANLPVSELVAIKYTGPRLAAREFTIAREIDRRFGAPVTYEHIGFVRSGNGAIGSITRYENAVNSIDNLLWENDTPPEKRIAAFKLAARYIAGLHSIKIIHGDSQAKNIAAGSNGNPRYIDFGQSYDVHEKGGIPEIHQLLDIADLFNPLFMPTPSPEEIHTFITEYLKSLGDTSLTYKDIYDSIKSSLDD